MGKIHDLLKKLDLFQYAWRAKVTAKKEIEDPRRQQILKTFNLSKEQEKKIDDFYILNYGKKISYDWHRYYSSYMHSFDEKYIPESMFISKIEAKFNPLEYSYVLSDKNLLPLLVGDNKKYRSARIYVSCTDGILRDEDYNLISKSKAFEILKNIGFCFYKPTIDSCSGKNCILYNFENGIDKISNKKLDDILKNNSDNYNFQELLKNCESARKLHPESLNTFRIVTYLLDNQIYHFPIIMRIGCGKANVDNAHQGGIFVGIDDDGNLKNCGFTEFQQRFYEHPDSKIKFDGYSVPEIRQCINAAHEMQAKLPQIKLISFDFIADEINTPVLIEMNLNYQAIWVSQMAHGKGAFGDNTAKVLNLIRG